MAQDETGIHVRTLPLDAEKVAAACGLPLIALTGWEQDMLLRVEDPVFGPDGEPLAHTDPVWLVRFAQAGMEAKFFWGPVREVPGSGPEALAAIAKAEMQDRPDPGL